MWLVANGTPQWLGTIVSSAGALVNNATTSVPFNTNALGPLVTSTPNSPANYTNTLAGKMLLLQATAAGSVLPSTTASLVASVASPILALQSVQPPLVGTTPGPLLGLNERVQILMLPNFGWLQWLPTSGAGNLHVWELT